MLTREATSFWKNAVLVRSAFSTFSSFAPSSGLMNAVAWRKSGRHTHFGHADAVAVKHIVMHFAAREQFRQYMPELFAHAQQPHGTALGTMCRYAWPYSSPFRFELSSQRPFTFLDFKDLEHIACLDVVGIRQHDTTFETSTHFVDIVLEPAQRGNRGFRHDDVFAGKTCVTGPF